MNAWSKTSSATHSGKLVSALLAELWDLYDQIGASDLKPKGRTYTTVIDAFAHSDGAVQAHDLLQDMWSKFSSDNHRELKPTIYSYCAVMNAYAKSSNDGGHNAVELLDDLWNRYEHGDSSMKPTLLAYNSCIDAVARSSSARKSAGEMAMELLKDMRDRAANGDAELKSDSVSLASAINAWARSPTTTETGRTIADLISETWDLYSIRGKEVPSLASYTAAFEAFAGTGSEEAGEQADQLLRELWSRHVAGHRGLKPDIRHYSFFMKAWANHPQAHRQVTKLVAEIHQRYDAGDRSFEPNELVRDAFKSAVHSAKEQSD